MKTLTLQIPDTVELNDREALLAIATRFYEIGRLSLGQAANLAGLSKDAFIEILGTYGVSVFNYEAADLEQDVMHAKSYHS